MRPAGEGRVVLLGIAAAAAVALLFGLSFGTAFLVQAAVTLVAAPTQAPPPTTTHPPPAQVAPRAPNDQPPAAKTPVPVVEPTVEAKSMTEPTTKPTTEPPAVKPYP